MELQSSIIISSTSMRVNNIRSCCRPTFQRNWLTNKGAILVLIWSFLCFSVYYYFSISKSRDPIKVKINLTPAELLAMGLLFPIGGWLADAYFGRYRVISFGMWTMWFGAMLNGFSLVIGKVVELYGRYGDPWVSFTCKVIMGAGLGTFQANIIQLGIDQLIDASSTEIKSFILWYTVSIFGSSVVLCMSSYCAPEYVAVLLVAVCLSVAVISNFLLNHLLVKEQLIRNPLPLILKVVYFVIKTPCPKHTEVWLEQQGLLSKFNVAKRVYNGPFTSEQVEDVKTFFRVIVVIIIFIIACSGLPTVTSVSLEIAEHLKNWPNTTSIKGCYMALNGYYFRRIFVVIAVLLYQIVVYPLLHKYIPSVSITTKFSCSVLFFFANVMALLGIESFSYFHQAGLNQTTVKCIFQTNHTADIDFYWLAIPFSLNGICSLLFIVSSMEFICAQAPVNMKGLVLGIGCALYGLSSLIQSGISIPFMHSNIWESAPLTCGIWYFIFQGLVVLVGFLFALLMVKMYKRRTRISISSHNDHQESD